MSKLSKEQIKAIEKNTNLYTTALLMCDGHKVDIREYRNKNRIRAVLHVDGYIKGIWLSEGAEYPESKFFPFMKIRVKKNIFNRKCCKMKTVTLKSRDMDFASVGQALRHLNKVCDSVEVIEGDE